IAFTPTVSLMAEESNAGSGSETVVQTDTEEAEDSTAEQAGEETGTAESAETAVTEEVSESKETTAAEKTAETEDTTVSEEKTETTETAASEENADAEGEEELILEDELSDEARDAASGTYVGTNVTWSVSGNTLTIGGSGAMPEYFPDWGKDSSHAAANYINDISNASGGSITKVVVKSGVTTISPYAFQDAVFSNLASVELPGTITDIGAFAFSNKTKLTSVTIPSGRIHESAFINCSGLTEVTIGSGVSEIGISAFESCPNIGKVNISDLAAWCNIYFGGIKANPTEVSHNLYLNGSPIADLTIPDSVSQVPDFAFQNVDTIKSVTIPGNVATIGEYAFYNAKNIAAVNISSGVKVIGAYAFEGAGTDLGESGLEWLLLPNTIEYIGEYAFNNTWFRWIEIPTGYIADYAISNAAKMISLGPDVVFSENAFANCNQLLHSIPAGTRTVPATVTLGSYKGEAIEWKVLNVSDGKALLVSSKVLDYQQFNAESYSTGGWANSTLRGWLNNTFLNEAGLGSYALAQTVSDSQNSKFGASIGTSTNDKIFLLSEQELTQYLPKADSRTAPASGYCQGANSNSARYNGNRSDKTAYYWLRTPGFGKEYAEFVGYNGSISYDGMYASNIEIGGVRPAMWVDASSVNIGSATKEVTTAEKTFDDMHVPTYDYIARLYKLILNRNPDIKGWQDWGNKVIDGERTGATAAEGFFLSDEMNARGLSNGDVVEILYLSMMNRPSDEDGKAYWVAALDSGVTYAGVLKGFAESDEFGMICNEYKINRGEVNVSDPRDINIGVTEFVARCYQKALGRQYEDAGLMDWCGQINSAENRRQRAVEVSTDGFFHSEEFTNKNLSNTDYVKVLYQTFLGREYEEAGLADWVGQLDRGEKNRDEVMAGFYNSEEYDNIMKSFGL
ncbi:MAG: DUF4214 domain-containing protein, partial [Lachnospiraceae bacterium]|nr:DUF4214 domain-containing protein [Lachnospiraceae bacterium]